MADNSPEPTTRDIMAQLLAIQQQTKTAQDTANQALQLVQQQQTTPTTTTASSSKPSEPMEEDSSKTNRSYTREPKAVWEGFPIPVHSTDALVNAKVRRGEAGLSSGERELLDKQGINSRNYEDPILPYAIPGHKPHHKHAVDVELSRAISQLSHAWSVLSPVLADLQQTVAASTVNKVDEELTYALLGFGKCKKLLTNARCNLAGIRGMGPLLPE